MKRSKTMQKEKREMCQQKFKDFEAIKVAENEQILVMDWKNKNGYSEYSIRYMLDKEKGNLIITGDLGAGIASWYKSLYPEKLASLLNDIGYFKSKIQCCTETYTYRYKDIEEDLMSIKKDLILDGYGETELEVDFNKILSLSTYIDGGVGAYPNDLTEIFEKYDRDWQQSEFAYLGRRVSNRIYFWAVGFQMAVDDLLRKEQRKNTVF